MSMKIFDTHSHYNCRQFKNDLDETIKSMKETVCGCINIGTNANSNTFVIKQSKRYNSSEFQMYASVGFFPTNLQDFSDASLQVMAKQLKDRNVVAVGEIGLDLHHATKREIPRQTECLVKQIEFARSINKPVIMHERDAFNEMCSALALVNGSFTGVMHSFSHGIKEAEKYLEYDLYFGFGGMCTYPANKEILDWAAICPENRILLETDSPYLSPCIIRKQRNDSRNIKYVAEMIGKCRGISADDVIYISNRNAEKLFGITIKD